MSICATFQGRVVKVKYHRHSKSKIAPVTARRGQVVGFSRKSRKRMLEMVATIDMPKACYFVTLTYTDNTAPLNGCTAKNALRAWLERVRRQWPESSAVWRMEVVLRKSGRWKGLAVPHFHLLMFNCGSIEGGANQADEYQSWVNKSWRSVIGASQVRTDCQRVKSDRGAMFYCSKYTAKVAPNSSPLVLQPYLHGEGRQWGIFNRVFLPVFPKVKVSIKGHESVFYDMRRSAVRKYPKIGVKRAFQGFTVFCDDALVWLDYLACLIE